ncbi:hypothetical protein [Glutamicibacter mysorens]|uniref:hypothetical protein n=1 Tax=Glutamicibacter mysorens TaxID=257984 RepID=UPI0020C6EB3D|nr:hypothetical protein [Glutamicibacter mysorens]UTM47045.1 hypothetical protein XH9_16145 [Glutamicibacter mysorens]
MKKTKADLEEENRELRRQVFIAESMIQELSLALSRAQVTQAQLNGQIKYANQPTA